jgi:ABC-type transporter MlaC component
MSTRQERARAMASPHFRPTRAVASLLAALAVCAFAPSGRALAEGKDDARTFVRREHDRLRALLLRPDSADRAAQVTRELDGAVDYGELTRRSFGEPCPAERSACIDHWKELTDAQKAEVAGLLRRLVQKICQREIEETRDYDVTYLGVKDQSGDLRVSTEAKSNLRPRDPSTLIDYVVHSKNGQLWMVDWVTEKSSMSKNYYDEFDRKMRDPALGYASIAAKLRQCVD